MERIMLPYMKTLKKKRIATSLCSSQWRAGSFFGNGNHCDECKKSVIASEAWQSV